MSDTKLAVFDFLTQARTRFLTAKSGDSDREERNIDADFLALKQWEDANLADRKAESIPSLTIDQLNNPVRQAVNQAKSAGLSIHVNPIDDADQHDAELRQGLIRHIEYESQAEHEYFTAFKHAVGTGLGWLKVEHDYAHDATRDQVFRISAVLDPNAIYCDPAYKKFNGSDMRYLFEVNDIPKEEFKDLYGEDAMRSLELFTASGNEAPDWFPEGCIRVAGYYYLETTKVEMAEIVDSEAQDGSTKLVPLSEVPTGVQSLGTRPVTRKQVMYALINAAQILEGNKEKTAGRPWLDLKGQRPESIPFVPVKGEELYRKGVRTLRGMVRANRDSQRMVNVEFSSLVMTVQVAPRAPYIGYEGQFGNQGDNINQQWLKANQGLPPYLEASSVTVDGKAAPLPQRQVQEPAILAIQSTIDRSLANIRSGTAYYDQSDPSQKNTEQSGKAILQRRAQGAETNSDMAANLAIAGQQIGCLLNNGLEAVYDRPGRIVKILGTDDQRKSVMLNQPYMEGPDKQPQAVNEPYDPQRHQLFDLKSGTFGVTVTVGTGNVTTQRQENLQTVIGMAQAYPNLVPMIMDLVAKYQDGPIARELYDRLHKIVMQMNPQLQEQGPEDPATLKQQNAQMQGQLQELSKLLQMADQEIKTDAVKQRGQVDLKKAEFSHDLELQKVEFAHKEALARIQAETTIAVQQMKDDLARSTEVFKAEQARIGVGRDTSIQWEQSQAERDHEMSLAEREHEQGLEAADRSAEHGLIAQQQQADLQPPTEAVI